MDASTENMEAKEAQEAFVREFPAEDIRRVFPRNTHPDVDHTTSPGKPFDGERISTVPEQPASGVSRACVAAEP